MARGGFSAEVAATALADAALTSDSAAARKHGVSRRSIENWRARLATDAELLRLFGEKRKALERAWADQMPASIMQALGFLNRACGELDPRDPNAIKAVVDALRVLIETQLVFDAIRARVPGLAVK